MKNRVEIEFFCFEEAEAALEKALESLRKYRNDTVVLEGDKLQVKTDGAVKELKVTQVVDTLEAGSTMIGASFTNL